MSKVSVQKLTKDAKGSAGNLLGKVRLSKDKVNTQISQLQDLEKQIAKKAQEEKAAVQEAAAAVAAAEKKAEAEKAAKSAAKQKPAEKPAEKPAAEKTAAKPPVKAKETEQKPKAAATPDKKPAEKKPTPKTAEKAKSETTKKIPSTPQIGIRVVKRAPTKEEKLQEEEKRREEREKYQQRNQERKKTAPSAGKPAQRPPQRDSYQKDNANNNNGKREYQKSDNRPYNRPGGRQDNRPDFKDKDDTRPNNRPQRQASGAKSASSDTTDAGIAKPTNRTSQFINKKKDKEKPDKKSDQQTKVKKTPVNPKQGKYAKTFQYGDVYVPTGSRRKKQKRSFSQNIDRIVIEKATVTTESVAIKDLAEKIGKQSSEIVGQLFKLGIMATVNNSIDFDTAEVVAAEFGVTLTQEIAKTQEERMMDEHEESHIDDEMLAKRAPIVTVMGHVDHGKTSLLDKIRQANVQAGEAGGITQHIGAYTVTKNGEPITFIDTPGHQAFTSMRARGAKVTDIAIIVVAADDSVMPQTIEAINHSKAAEVPIIVAINKCDLPAANPAKVKQELTEHGIVAEEWGGEHIMCEVSAKTGEGIDTLLEMILLQAEILELKANPEGKAIGTIIESQLDKGRGPVATVLVKNGTLHVGDGIVSGLCTGRVRAMMNDKGEKVESAGPAMPVEVVGFSEVPDAGDTMYAADEKRIRKVAEERKVKKREEMTASSSAVSLDELFGKIEEGKLKDLNIIVKADVQGSAEAIKQSLEKLSNAEVRVRCIHTGVGGITESDVLLASASSAIIIGFNVRPDASGRTAAEKENIDVRTYRIIYEAIQDVESAMKGLLAPVFKEEVTGHAEVRSVFKVTGVGNIAGCYVTDGKIKRSSTARVLRDSVVIFEGAISSLKRFKDDAKEVAQNYECGIGIENFNDVKEGDVIEAFEKIQIEH